MILIGYILLKQESKSERLRGALPADPVRSFASADKRGWMELSPVI